jgi:hypothetical protein
MSDFPRFSFLGTAVRVPAIQKQKIEQSRSDESPFRDVSHSSQESDDDLSRRVDSTTAVRVSWAPR